MVKQSKEATGLYDSTQFTCNAGHVVFECNAYHVIPTGGLRDDHWRDELR